MALLMASRFGGLFGFNRLGFIYVEITSTRIV